MYVVYTSVEWFYNAIILFITRIAVQRVSHVLWRDRRLYKVQFSDKLVVLVLSHAICEPSETIGMKKIQARVPGNARGSYVDTNKCRSSSNKSANLGTHKPAAYDHCKVYNVPSRIFEMFFTVQVLAYVQCTLYIVQCMVFYMCFYSTSAGVGSWRVRECIYVNMCACVSNICNGVYAMTITWHM